MRFAPKTERARRNSVRTRLTLAVLGVIMLSWLLGLVTFRFFLEQDIKRFNADMEGPDRGRISIVGPMGRLSFDRPPDAPAGPQPPGGPPPGQSSNGRPGPGGPKRLPRPFSESMMAQAVAGVVLALFAGWLLSRNFTRPLSALAEGARAFHNRQLSHRIPVSGNDEFSDLAVTMNEMADEVGAQIQALEDDAQRRRQVLADVAHELRSPVATLEAMTAALQDGLAEQPERRAEALAYMRDSTGRMKRLVNDLLEVARLDLHEIPLSRSPVDLRDIVEDAVNSHRAAAEQAGLRFAPFADDEAVMVEADALRLSQVVDNLVENAISYAGSGTEIRVSVTREPPGIVVEDNGVGIPAQHLPFVFDPFYRADQARTPGENHSGLGLRIARGLMDAHGGTLELESAEGKGTRAVLTLPRGTAGDA